MHAREGSRVKKSKKARGGRSDDADDAASTMSDDAAAQVMDAAVSGGSGGGDGSGEALTEAEQADALVEALAEKRASTRNVALTRLSDQLQRAYSYDFVSSRLDTLQLYITNSVKKGDGSEVALACRALQLLAVTLGAESERLVAHTAPVLLQLLKNTSKGATARAACAEALGFLQFMAGGGTDAETEAAMAPLVELLSPNNAVAQLPEAVATAAWEAWGLLASTLPTHKLAALQSSALPLLQRWLEHEGIDAKTAAGQNIALIIEAKQAIDAEKADEQQEEERPDPSRLPNASPTAMAAAVSPEAPAVPAAESKADVTMSDAAPAAAADSSAPGSAGKAGKKRAFKQTKAPSAGGASSSSSSSGGGGGGAAFDHAGLVAKLGQLATDGSKRTGKKERATQRKSFRDILKTVEDGDVPEESLKIEKSRHDFSGWSQILQLDALRDVLGKGVNVHFVANETVAEIFDLFIESGEGVDDPKRKAASRAQSRQKQLDNFHSREKGRKKKAALTNVFAED